MDEAGQLYQDWSAYVEALLTTYFGSQRDCGIYWSTEDQEDLSQDVRIKVLKALSVYDPSKSSPKTYIWRVVHHQLKWRGMDMRGDGHGRSNAELNARMVRIDDEDANFPEPVAPANDDFDMKELLASFDPAEREYIQLKLAGYGAREIRRMMGISERQLAALRRQIRDRLHGVTPIQTSLF